MAPLLTRADDGPDAREAVEEPSHSLPLSSLQYLGILEAMASSAFPQLLDSLLDSLLSWRRGQVRCLPGQSL